ncbi:hypothetical protein B0J12DRAFT_652095 [Macrophomina phaseolina]|uniref:Secreted protein n=1 Tax=Macrophomina phaseolina TaxID=35725 RepID=A0ABQ8GLD9_9PEZI|nr:hypothetical protein B0J12DRAFT_652095 [Macrophomina phaseolina]
MLPLLLMPRLLLPWLLLWCSPPPGWQSVIRCHGLRIDAYSGGAIRLSLLLFSSYRGRSGMRVPVLRHNDFLPLQVAALA